LADTIISPFDWGTITDSIRGGRCVPFLGAGVNVSAGGYAGLPLGGEVATRLLAKLVDSQVAELAELVTVVSTPALSGFEDLVRLRAQDLARVALHVQFAGGNPRLLELLREILADEDCRPSTLLSTLAALPLRLIVTTNYDGLMEKAVVEQRGPSPFVVVQPIGGFRPGEQRSLQRQLVDVVTADARPRADEEPVVIYKIHGTLGGGSTEVIVSEEDYIEFLTVVGHDSKAGVPRLISNLMVDSSLLFLGYSLEDWDFRTLYKGLVETLPYRQKRMSFALQKDPSSFWENYWARKQVKIYNVDLYEFADELRRRTGL
jgi:hypothetical protein